MRESATRECARACADVRVPVYLVEYVYYMTPFDFVQFVYSLNITVIIVMSVFIYYYLLWIFCHSVLFVDQPLPLVVYASYRVCLTVMPRRAARTSS